MVLMAHYYMLASQALIIASVQQNQSPLMRADCWLLCFESDEKRRLCDGVFFAILL